MAKEKLTKAEMETDDFHERVNEAMSSGDDPETTVMKKKLTADFNRQNQIGGGDPPKTVNVKTVTVKTNKKMSDVDAKEKAYQQRLKEQNIQIDYPKEKKQPTQKKSLQERSGRISNPKTVLGIDLRKSKDKK